MRESKEGGAWAKYERACNNGKQMKERKGR
jgi:hypothetical protein